MVLSTVKGPVLRRGRTAGAFGILVFELGRGFKLVLGHVVGPVEKNLIGPPGYSFQLLDNRSIAVQPIVTFMYEHQFDAANARFIMEQALMNACS